MDDGLERVYELLEGNPHGRWQQCHIRVFMKQARRVAIRLEAEGNEPAAREAAAAARWAEARLDRLDRATH